MANLSVIERDRLIALLTKEQVKFIENKRDEKTRQLWIRLLCDIRGIKKVEAKDQAILLKTLDDFVYSHMLMGAPGTTPYKCQKCGRNLRYQYHLVHSQSQTVLKLGIECFRHVLNVDKQVDLDLRREITRGERLFMDHLMAFRDNEIEKYLPILDFEEAPEIYLKQIRLGLPLTKHQEIDFERWYRDYIYEQEMAEYILYKKERFNQEQFDYIEGLTSYREEQLMNQLNNRNAYISYEAIKDLKASGDAKERARLELPLTNRQLSQYNRLTKDNKRSDDDE